MIGVWPEVPLLAAIIELTTEQAGGDVVGLVAFFCALLLVVALWIEWRGTGPRE